MNMIVCYAVANEEQAYVAALFRVRTLADAYARDWNENTANMKVRVFAWELPAESFQFAGDY